MFTINLKDFFDLTQGKIFSLLLNARTFNFEIIIPKTHNPVDDDEFLLFWEYHMMAYVGQQLNDLSSEFSYAVPFPNSNRHFVFYVKTDKLMQMAELLCIVSMCMFDDSKVDATTDFQFKASQYFNDAFDNKVDASTWGLLVVANNFLFND